MPYTAKEKKSDVAKLTRYWKKLMSWGNYETARKIRDNIEILKNAKVSE
jgi:protein-arginine kinase activator protein McsA